MPLALPPTEIVAVGDALTVVDRLCVLDELSEPDGVCDAVTDAVPVLVSVLVAVGVTERLAVDVVLSVPLSEPVLDGFAPLVTLAVGDREKERDSESVDVGVWLWVGVALGVSVAVPDALVVHVGAIDAVKGLEGLPLALLFELEAGVAVAVTELIPSLRDGVTDGVTEDEVEGDGDEDSGVVHVIDAIGDSDTVPLALLPELGVVVGVGDGVELSVAEGLSGAVPLALLPELGVVVGVGDRVELSVELTVSVGLEERRVVLVSDAV